MGYRIAYADPPYPGQARRHYKSAEVDHAALLEELCTYDGWALSTSSPALRDVLARCGREVRVAAWVKPFAIYKPGINPGYCWEPVLFVPVPRRRERTEKTVRDWVSANVTLKRGLVGVKPEAFCFWLFELLGMRSADTFVDLYPGSYAVTRAWEQWASLKV